MVAWKVETTDRWGLLLVTQMVHLKAASTAVVMEVEKVVSRAEMMVCLQVEQ